MKFTNLMKWCAAVVFFLLTMQQASATLAVTAESPSADGFDGSIGTPYETSGTGTFDVYYSNMVGTDYYYKRAFCGGAVATYFTLPNSGSASLGGLTVTLVNGAYGRIYRFSGVPVGSPQPFCFVSKDGYMSATITSTAVAVTPTPIISNLRIVADAAVTGGSKLCVDYTPVNPVITSFSWIENGVTKATGPATALWTSYVCWDRNQALVQGNSYGLQLKYSGPGGDTYSNYLSIAIPVTRPGMPTNVTATQNSSAYPGQVYVSWTPGANSTGVGYYLYRYDSSWLNPVWIGWTGNLVNNGPSNFLDTPPLTGVAYHYAVTAYASASSQYSDTGNTVTPGIALPVPLTCSAAMTGAPQTVTSTTSSVRVSVYGVTNATSVNIALWGDVNGQNDLTSLPATNDGGGTWYVDAPLLSPQREFGTFSARAYLTGAAGANVPCNTAVTVFTRRASQSSTFVTQTVAGAVDPWRRNLLVNRSYPVSITFTNSGQSTWQHATTAAGAGHKVHGDPQEPWTGTGSLLFPVGTTLPGGTATATGTLTTSATPAFGALFTIVYDDPIEYVGQWSPNVFISTYVAPTAPTALQASDAAFGDKVRLTWTRGGNASSQLMLRAAVGTAFPAGTLTGQPPGWSIVCPGLASAAITCDDTTALSGVFYDYRVFALAPSDGLDYGGWELGVASASDTGYALMPITTAPQNFTASSEYADRIQLNWSPFSGASSFDIQRTLADVNRTVDGAVVAITPGALTTIGDTSIPRGLSRCYKIRAVNAAGAGPWSNEACGLRVGLTVPALTASQGTVNGATRLTWAAPVGYTATQSGIWRLRSRANLSDWENIATLPGSPGSFDDTSARGADVDTDFYLLNQVDDAGNWGYWAMTTVSNYSSNIASGYANLAPTSVAATINAVANQPSSPTLITTIDPNATAGQSETFVYSVMAQPAAGQGGCAIAGASVTWTPDPSFGFAGTTTCTLRVTDRGAATKDGPVTIKVDPFVPSIPTGVAATDGTVNNAVTITWLASVGASSYRVFRNGAQIGTSTTATFTDLTPGGPTTYAYAVAAVSASGGASALSLADNGYANVAPTSAVATISTGAENVATPVAPIVVDSNPGQTFIIAIATQPALGQGSAAVVNNLLVYSPPVSADFTGTTTFTFTATDPGGLSVVGTATVTVSCRAPTILGASVSADLTTLQVLTQVAACGSPALASGSVSVTGYAVGFGPAVNNSTGTAGGRAYTVLAWALPLDLADGNYTLNVTVTNGGASNASTAVNSSLLVDWKTPSALIFSNSKGAVANGATATPSIGSLGVKRSGTGSTLPQPAALPAAQQ